MTLRPLAALASLFTIGAAGCHRPPPVLGCMETFAGDPALPIEAVVTLDINGTMIDVTDGEAVDVLPPPQGGFVVYGAVRVRNVDPCGVLLKGAFRDAMPPGAVLSDFDRRSADLHARGDGWYEPPSIDFASVPNIPVCPDNTGGSLLGKKVLLEINLTDREKRSVTVSQAVTLRCPPGACFAECSCICGPGYQPDKCSRLDGGVLDGAISDGGGSACVR